MKSRIILTILIIFSYYPLLAQKNNIEIGLGGYKFLNVIGQLNNLINSINIKYDRNINNNIGVYAQYIRAPIHGWLSAQREYAVLEESIGKLTSHNQYNYFDLGVSYKIYKYKSHQLSAYSSLSMAHGEDYYLDYVIWTEPLPGEPYGHPIDAGFDKIKENYFGGVIGLAYDYALWKDRLYMGLNLSSRYYLNNFPFQFNYGLQIGYTF